MQNLWFKSADKLWLYVKGLQLTRIECVSAEDEEELAFCLKKLLASEKAVHCYANAIFEPYYG